MKLPDIAKFKRFFNKRTAVTGIIVLGVLFLLLASKEFKNKKSSQPITNVPEQQTENLSDFWKKRTDVYIGYTDILREKADILVNNLAIAKQIKPEINAIDYREYTNTELGFTLRYPSTWGAVNFKVNRQCIGDDKNTDNKLRDIQFSGTFSKLEDKYGWSVPMFGATIEMCLGRGLGTFDYLWHKGKVPTEGISETINLSDNENIKIWYAMNLGYQADAELEYSMAAQAPLHDKQFSGIAFIGPLMIDNKTTKEDIAGFLLMIRSFKLLK